MNVSTWIDALPEDWRTLPLKFVADIKNSNVDKKSYEDGIPVRLCNYTDVYYNDYITSGMDMMLATATVAELRRFSLRRGDVIITKDSESWNDIAIPACVADELDGVVCGYHLTIMRPVRDVIHGPFLLRCLQASGIREQLWLAANGVTRFGLGQQGIRDALVPLPPLPVQCAITDFLDRKIAAIDALVEKKERLIALLAEKRATLVHLAITRGLEPGVRMKDSGVSWIGEIPAHWQVKRLKRISPSQTVGVVVNPSLYVTPGGDVPFIYGSDVSAGRIDVSGARRISHEDNRTLAKSKLRAGDIVVVRVGAPGISAVVPPELDGINCASMMIVRGAASFCSRWLEFAMNSGIGAVNVELVAYGAAQKQFNISHAVDFLFPVPPLNEQIRIADYLTRRAAHQSAMVQRLEMQIARLREYRQALITTAVTGLLDIGGSSP